MSGDYIHRTYQDGENIFLEGDRAGEAFLINKGNVRIYKVEGSEIHEIDVIGPGQIFGEMGVISDMNRMASAVAIGETELNCCHRRELKRRVDALDEDMRDALRFLIVYCQEFLPFELMSNRPNDAETKKRDALAYYLVRDSKKPGELDRLDVFLKGLYRVLVSYTERRLPPGFEP